MLSTTHMRTRKSMHDACTAIFEHAARSTWKRMPSKGMASETRA
jgi:hypothetical protein